VKFYGQCNLLSHHVYFKDYQGSRSSIEPLRRSVGGSLMSLTSSANDSVNEPFHQSQRKNIMSSIAEEARSLTGDGIPYTVRVKTGDVSNADTSANVSIRLIGRRSQETQWIPLELMQRRRFERGKVETFSLQERRIGDLKCIEIQHDGETPADSWFLDNISIEMPTEGRIYHFPCNKWLSKHKDDGLSRRTLFVDESHRGSFRPCT
jgi:hypothetical protein